MKSSAPLALVGILGCILIAGCNQTREAKAPRVTTASPLGSDTFIPPAASYQVGSFELQENKSSQKVRGASVTRLFFQNEEMPTLVGRGFLPEEYASGRQQVVLISHRLWQQRFAGDPQIIGATMRLNGQPFKVIGIMPATFDVPSGVDIWVPKAG